MESGQHPPRAHNDGDEKNGRGRTSGRGGLGAGVLDLVGEVVKHV